MMYNPIIAMLINIKTNRWHPIVFREAPLPGGGGPRRHKSKGHHTMGFDTREEALLEAAKIAEDVKAEALGPVLTSLEGDFPWDGEGVPSMVMFFGTEDDKVVPILGS